MAPAQQGADRATDRAIDRALGALMGGALGDALGMPTQTLSPREIKETFGRVTDFVAPRDDHPVSRGLPAGTVTDDTEQTLLLAKTLLASEGAFDDRRWVEVLVDWEADVKARGSYDLLGPSTKRAIDAIRSGVPPAEAGRYGDTNGAAMRAAPVGIIMPPEPLDGLIAKVAETCRATHNTSIAIASASAVAAAVSAGIGGTGWRGASALAVKAARHAGQHGHWAAGADIATRIAWALKLVDGRDRDDALEQVIALVGTSVAAQESVPAAFAVLSLAEGDAWQAAVLGANLGGDTDTIGAIAAGMAGACGGFSTLPADKVSRLRGIDLGEVETLVSALIDRRLGDQRQRMTAAS
ncbi:ADP-ribosylglycohydrolase family protein [Pelagibius litoralis]|uniref:ADP-ribosylglycohydrolase family protein n=1 Tax=Pelagibius litoralis TaxID=374515 RepID=A0A967F2I7_9PROT|nr:ADP-ribosylglycohydrolase family protein [Pelagibius litoralis]NIA71725.1 ADP-ribosylglycohydrolase family protein [Pelagibius litoralis]